MTARYFTAVTARYFTAVTARYFTAVTARYPVVVALAVSGALLVQAMRTRA